MKNPSKGTAACWDCHWYITHKGQLVCTCPDKEKVLSVMPMKCKDKAKSQ